MKFYQETLDFLYEQLPMFSRIGSAAYKKDLTNTVALCDFFGNPQNKFKSIHVGGTNGKGSTTNYLASMFVESGLKVGIYTSPHLIDFRERIKIGNEMIIKNFVVEFVEKSKPLIEKLQPSFFELTVVMAFEYFASQKVDIAIIEVGLGGRLDSTNVITPELSVITNVSFDHMNMLGNTIESIATEKAGIIKNNISIIIGESNQNYNFIFENKAVEMNSELFYASEFIQFDGIDNRFIYNDFIVKLNKEYTEPPYQIKNIKTSILSFIKYMEDRGEVNNSKINQSIERGIHNRTKNTGFLGRWTKIEYQDRVFILESAHNEAGILELRETLEELTLDNILIIFGCVKDKDVSRVISLLPISHKYILTQADIPRATGVEELERIFIENNIHPLFSVNKVSDAIAKAIENSISGDTILVTGSIFLVGEILGIISKK